MQGMQKYAKIYKSKQTYAKVCISIQQYTKTQKVFKSMKM